ncbi:MAG: hypothetical protein ACI8QZ_001813 [Chlamydiales bacterium]|jgi:hypothetical protein
MTLLSTVLLVPAGLAQADESDLARAEPVVGDSGKLERRFERWNVASDQALQVTFPLAWSKARSAERTSARGVARVDRVAARLDVELSGLEGRRRVDLWLVPYPEGDSAARLLCGVELVEGAGRVQVRTAGMGSVELERLVVVESGGDLGTESLLHGAPGLFERVATRRAATVGGVPLTVDAAGLLERADAKLDPLVGIGERIFFGQTFAGNGRTCGTCHPPENDFTIDPEFIASLPSTHPLFIAEQLPALDSAQNGGLVFENPRLMRDFGLIVVNADGFGNTARRFVMRGVQHLLGLGRTIEPAPNLDQPLVHLLGWSGDGSTGTGSLREFTDGAVTQHFPLTMGRVAGQDFRLPTPEELNALEAFMLSIGREHDINVERELLDAGADAGRRHFTGLPSCNQCHRNGGSSSNFGGIGIGDFLQNTGVELTTQRQPDGTGERRPVDAGFGTNPQGDFESMIPNEDHSFGERTFNSQSVIEAASTMPSFHSNLNINPNSGLEPTIEGAVRFYTTPDFAEAAGFEINLTEQEIAELGRFLRVLSAADDVKTARGYAKRAAAYFAPGVRNHDVGNRVIALAAVECRDARSVLTPVGLHPVAVDQLTLAASAFANATAGPPGARLARIEAGLAALDAAHADMVVPPNQ